MATTSLHFLRRIRRLANFTKFEGILLTNFDTSRPPNKYQLCFYNGKKIGRGRMLEVSQAGVQEWPREEGGQEEDSALGLRERASRLCRDYLRGAWLAVSPQDMVFKKVSGGLSNLLYYCALPEGIEPTSSEPNRLLLRLYGSTNQDRAMETLITESVIFTLLSESQRGPRLYGVFPGGRLEEYIEARPLKTEELANATLSSLIADKLAQIHLMDVPINKQPKIIWQTMERWLQEIKKLIANKSFHESSHDMMDTLEQLNLYEEYVWLKDFLTSIKSPVVFCHNDLQEGNILLRNKNDVKKKIANDIFENDYDSLTKDSLVVIDFEYCSYNYRGFDFANHFCEWQFDYSNEEPPYFWELPHNEADANKKRHFIESYLNALKSYPEYKPKPEDTVENLMREVKAFTLAAHFFWGLWSVIYSTSTEISFDYWSFGEVRFQAYYNQKKLLMEDPEFRKTL